MKNNYGFFNTITTLLVRNVTAFIMFILHVKVLCLFIEISMSILFVKARSTTDGDGIDMKSFFELTNNDYGNNVIGLPNYTLHVIWSEKVLEEEHRFSTGIHSVRTVIQNRELMKVNLEQVTDIVLKNLPFLMKLKLGISSEVGRSDFRKSVVEMLNNKFSTHFA